MMVLFLLLDCSCSEAGGVVEILQEFFDVCVFLEVDLGNPFLGVQLHFDDAVIITYGCAHGTAAIRGSCGPFDSE
jgi:hypothetical protein